MTKIQFRVLYREFLFRMVDLEVLSAHALGDSNKLLGQLGALLVFISLNLTFAAFIFASAHMSPTVALLATMVWEHFLVATTMLVVGVFAVLSWDSTFPDRRDVLVLGPLPVRGLTMFRAKVAAVATGLALTVALLHGASALIWPIAFAVHATPQMVPALAKASPFDWVLVPAATGFTGLLRWFGAYWFTMLAAGGFIYCGVLGLQGLAAQLFPRRLFLRVSGWLQLSSFCLFVVVYSLQPVFGGIDGLAGLRLLRLVNWLPSYWFLGMFHQLNGSMHPILAPLAQRAWIGLGVVFAAAALAYTLSYVRTLRKIMEEPDIVPGAWGIGWLPPFGDKVQTAIGQFAVRTLLRSRQHRMILAFYLGVGFALALWLLKAPAMKEGLPDARANSPWRQADTPILASSILILVASVVGTRVVFAMPLDLRANWVFRVVGVRPGATHLVAVRRALLLLSVAPVWTVTAAICLRLWPWRQAAGHLVLLGSLGFLLVELALRGFRKIPFTCSYLPGKSHVNMVFLTALGVLYFVIFCVQYEVQALQRRRDTFTMATLFAAAAVAARLAGSALARSGQEDLRFEEAAEPAVLELGLHRDGVMPTGPIEPA
jgi:hypothetical protein